MRQSLQGRALRHTGNLARDLGDFAASRAHLARALRISEELGDTEAITLSNLNLGKLAMCEFDLGSARTHFEASLAGGRALDNSAVTASSLLNLGSVLCLQGEWAESRRFAEEALASYRRLGKGESHAVALEILGTCALAEGDLAAAGASFRDALRYIREVNIQGATDELLERIAAVVARQGGWVRAARLAGAAAALRDRVEARASPGLSELRERYLGHLRSALGDDGLAAAIAEGRALSVDEAVEEALNEAGI